VPIGAGPRLREQATPAAQEHKEPSGECRLSPRAVWSGSWLLALDVLALSLAATAFAASTAPGAIVVSATAEAIPALLLAPSAAALLALAVTWGRGHGGGRRVAAGAVLLAFAPAVWIGVPGMGGSGELLWSLSFACAGVGVLVFDSRARASMRQPPQRRPDLLGGTWPATLVCIFLLTWSGLHPPIAPALLFVSGVVIAIVATRMALSTRLERAAELALRRAAVQSERRRMAEELHRSAKQVALSVPLLLGAYREALRTGGGDADALLDRAVAAARESSDLVTRPIAALHARPIDADLTASDPVGRLLRDLRLHLAVPIIEDRSASLARLTPAQLSAVLQIVSEALWNAGRHAGASAIVVTCRDDDQGLVVTVRDDGRGFALYPPPSGYGLVQMRADAASVAATLKITSATGAGTTVELRVPWA
jgi:signal transduction histidine kinase